MDAGVCDRYIFSDAAYVRNNIMDFLDVDNEEGDILLYQNVSRILTAIGWEGTGRRDDKLVYRKKQDMDR